LIGKKQKKKKKATLKRTFFLFSIIVEVEFFVVELVALKSLEVHLIPEMTKEYFYINK